MNYYNPNTKEIKSYSELKKILNASISRNAKTVGDWTQLIEDHAFPDEYHDIVEGEIVLNQDDGCYHKTVKIVEKNINTIKESKIANIKNFANRFTREIVNEDMYVDSSLGFKINADIRSQNNMRGLLDNLGDSGKTAQYRDYDNVMREVTAADLKVMLNECFLNGANLYQQKWEKEQAVANAQTLEDLQNISLDFVMLSFNSTSNKSE